MKILSIYIENFGKLSNFSFDFEDGINTIVKENGFGKTTLASFIKAMFFGLDYSRKKELYDRTRYLPWNEQKCGGYLIFSKNDKIYRIQRTFSTTSKNDTFMLFDESTNTVSYDYSENIGEEIFNIDKTSFENTAFINLENKSKLLTQIISSKLNNNSALLNDTDEYENAVKTLDEKATNLYSKRGNKGKIPQLKEKIEECKRKLFDLNTTGNQVNELIKNVGEIDKQLNDIEKMLIKTYPQNNTQSQSEVDQLIENYQKSCKLQNKINALSLELSQIKARLKNQNKNKRINKIFIAFSVLTAIISIVFLFLNPLFTVLFLLFAFIFLSVYFINDKRIKKYIKKYNIKEMSDEIESLNQKKDFIDDTYKSFIIKYNPNDRLDNILQSLMEIKFSQNTLSYQSNQRDLMDKKNNLVSKKILIKEKISALSVDLEQRDSIISDIDKVNEEISLLQEKYEIYIKTMEYIEIARKNLASKYINSLSQNFYKYLKMLGILQFDDYKIDINLDVSILNNGQLFKSDYFSLGYKDLINICIRFALIETVFSSGEKPVIILDDCFSNLDDVKLTLAKKLVLNLSHKYQVIYFTCHKSRKI